jgi:tripartite-type tricarboxylate transporter receptor subunit TctC
MGHTAGMARATHLHRRRNGWGTSAAVLLGVLAASTPLCRAQGAYPAKPVHLIVPSTAGGTTDIVGRALAQALSQQPVLEHVRAGTLRALAVTSAARSDLLPDVPTIAQSGVPGFSAVIHYGLLAPAGTPHDIIDRLNAALVAALSANDVRARVVCSGPR